MYIYIYMYICIYVYMFVCVYIHVHRVITPINPKVYVFTKQAI